MKSSSRKSLPNNTLHFSGGESHKLALSFGIHTQTDIRPNQITHSHDGQHWSEVIAIAIHFSSLQLSDSSPFYSSSIMHKGFYFCVFPFVLYNNNDESGYQQ